jgi:nucleoside-diphosphate-sugar epimerase
VFNVGGSEPIAHRELVTMLIDAAGSGSVRFVEWPEEKRRIDIGSFYSDSSKFQRTTGWRPTVELRDGFTRTLAYYREHFPQYVDAAGADAGEPR